MADLVELIGNPRTGSRTRALADAAATALLPVLADASVILTGSAILELADIVAVSFDSTPAVPRVPTDDPLGTVRSARLLIVATPTYKGTYTGLLKLFLDRYGHQELAGVVAVPVSISASEAHRVSVSTTLTDLLGELGATVPAPSLSILEPDAADPVRAAADWAQRHGKLVAAALAGPVP